MKTIPSLKSATCCLVTDKELAIIKAADLVVPKLIKLLCWNHIFRDVRFWLLFESVKLQQEKFLYLDDISQLFHSSSEAEYSEKLEEHSITWDSAFHQYYIEKIHPDMSKTCRWALEPLGVICTPYSGVTNNQSEGFNRVIKDFQSWKEAPLDSFVLALFQLQAYYGNEIKRGLAGTNL